MAAFLAPSAAAKAFRSRLPLTGTTPTASLPSTSTISVLKTLAGIDAQDFGRLRAVAGGGGIVGVGVQHKGNAGRSQNRGGRRSLGSALAPHAVRCCR